MDDILTIYGRYIDDVWTIYMDDIWTIFTIYGRYIDDYMGDMDDMLMIYG